MTALLRLLDKMLPGDQDTGLPPFSALSVDVKANFLDRLPTAVADLEDNPIDDEDVNETIKRLRAIDASLAQALVETALELYFTHPQVTSVLQQGRTTLFPHERSLDTIDYDLLEPVFKHQRGRRS